MRVMIHGVPPWAPSGYGVQGRLLAEGLAAAGHDVTYSAYGGFIREEPFGGIPVLACGGSAKGVGRIAYNYRRAKADVMITVCDLWPLDAREFEGLNVVSWLPVDCDPLGMPDQIQIKAAAKLCASFTPVAMSEHGERMLNRFITQSLVLEKYVPVIPHMLAPEYKTGDRWAWRKENGIPDSAFLVSTVGVNGDYPCRKGFPELLAAWQVFSERHPDARLYMHTLASPGIEGVDLLQIAKSLGLGRSVGFPDQLKRMSDELGPEYMAGMYRASDVFVMASLGEGFSVPVIEANACGTPVIASIGSALLDRAPWVGVKTQPSWNKLHNAWWHVPLVADLVNCLDHAYFNARDREVRREAKLAAAQYRPEVVMPQWLKLLEEFA